MPLSLHERDRLWLFVVCDCRMDGRTKLFDIRHGIITIHGLPLSPLLLSIGCEIHETDLLSLLAHILLYAVGEVQILI